MKVILSAIFLHVLALVHGQTWTDSNGGIVVKTLYLPLRKGRSSLALQDLTSGRHMTTVNIPFLPLKQKQRYHPKSKQIDTTIIQLQDARPKTNHYPKSEVAQLQVSNYYNPYQGQSFQQQQQQYGGVQQQSPAFSTNQNVEAQNQIYQPQQYMTLQTNQQNNYPGNYQHSSDSGVRNGNSQSGQSTYAEGSSQNVHNSVHFSEHVYPSHTFVAQKSPVASGPLYSVQDNHQTYPQSYAVQNSHQTQYESVSNQDAAMSQKPTVTFAGESSRFMRQVQAEANPPQSSALTNQRPLYVSHHQQNSYAQQDSPVTQQAEHVYANNQYQNHQAYDKKQLLTSNHLQNQPLTNTYAIVHQRIPKNNNYVPQDVSVAYQQQAEQNQGYTSKQAPDSYVLQADENQGYSLKPLSEVQHMSQQTNFVDRRPVEYIKISDISNHLSVDGQQSFPENIQQTLKKDDGSSKSRSSSSYPLTAKVQVIVPHFPSLQDAPTGGQYLTQQPPGPSSYQTVQSFDYKVAPPQQQSSAQTVYPDPSSETYYPENKQVYMAPPQGYSTPVQGQQLQQQQQQRQSQSGSEQNYVSKHPTYSDTSVHHSQMPLMMQSEQLGIHIAIPNNY